MIYYGKCIRSDAFTVINYVLPSPWCFSYKNNQFDFQFITTNYQEDGDSYSKECSELEQLRNVSLFLIFPQNYLALSYI